MASEKDIKINFKTSADTKGAKDTEKSLDELQAEIDQLREKIKKLPADSKAFVDVAKNVDVTKSALKETSKNLDGFTSGSDKASKSSRNMGSAVLEASRAFEDAQYGIRGVLNNLPGLVMMLGGTAGIAGAASVAAVAMSILAPKIKEIFSSADDAESLNKFNDLLKETSERVSEVAEKKSAKAQREWLETLDDEEEAITRQNSLLTGNIKLLEARRLATLSIADAERERRKAEVDASDMSDADKIKAKAAIDEEGEFEKAREETRKIRDQISQKESEATSAESTFSRSNEDLAIATKAREEAEKEAKRLEGLRQRELQKEKNIPALQRKAGDFQRGVIANDFSSDEERIEFRKLSDKAQAELEDAQAAAGRRASIEKQIGVNKGKLEPAKAKETELKTIVDQQRIAAQKARDEANQQAAIGTTQIEGVVGTYREQSSTRAIRADSGAAKAQEAADKKAAKEAREEEIRKAEEKLATQQSLIPGMQSQAADQLKNAGLNVQNPNAPNAQALRDTLLGASKTLSDGADQKEMQKIASEIEALTKNISNANIDTLKTIIASQNAALQQIKNLQGQIKTLRDNK